MPLSGTVLKTKNEDDEKLHMAPGTHFFNTVFVLPGSVVLAYTLVEVASLETLNSRYFGGLLQKSSFSPRKNPEEVEVRRSLIPWGMGASSSGNI